MSTPLHERLTTAGKILCVASQLLAELDVTLVSTVMVYQDESGDVAYGVALREENDLREIRDVLTQMLEVENVEPTTRRVH